MRRHPDTLKTTIYKLRALFGAMAIVLTASVITTFLVGREVLEARDRVQATDNAQANLRDTFSAIQDAESGQRGYLLTGDDAYLDPFRNAVGEIRNGMVELQDLTSSGYLTSQGEMNELVARKLAELQKAIDLTQTGRKENALAMVKQNLGQVMMDEIRHSFLQIQLQLDQKREKADTEADHATTFRTGMFLVTILINLSFLFWAFKRIQREMSLQYVAALESDRQREILAVTLSSIGDGVIITNTTGRITFINQVAEDLTGWRADQAQGEPCAKVFRIINEDSRSPVESPVDKVLASGTIVGLANHTLLIRKDGSELPIDDSGAPIREQDGTMRGVVLVFRDFSVNKEAERNLLQSKKEVEEASKAKDKFLAMLSHELRTPLTPVLATLSAWEAKRQLPAELEPDLKLIRRNVELESKLIDNLLDITRIEHGKLFLKMETVDVHTMIHAVVSLFKPECNLNGVELSFFNPSVHPFVSADPARLQQILWNIIGNAVKFSSRGDRILIGTSTPSSGEAQIIVSDTGAGMSQATLDGLFERFHQGSDALDTKTGGLGLGLYIARALAEVHRGSLQAASGGPGKGSTFTLTLPTVAASGHTAPSIAPETAPVFSKHILLLEDHADTAQVLSQVMRGMGHSVETCDTVAGALKMIELQKFDLILSDLGLPDASGIDFIRKVRETLQIPAVALTGYGMSEDIKKCLAAGFDDHLTKPIDFQRLQKTLQAVTRRQV